MIVIFIMLFLLTKKLYKKNGITPSVFIFATYLFSTILGLFYYCLYRNEIYHYSYFSMIYYAATLYAFLLPLIKHSGISESFYFSRTTVRYISILLIFFGIISLFSAVKDFSLVDLMGNWNDVRAEYYLSWGEGKIETSFLKRVQSNVSHVLFFCLPLAFYNLSKGNKRHAYLLIIVSFTTLVESLQNAERQNLILWFANLLMSYIMFRNLLDEKMKHRFNVVMIVIVVLLLFFLIAITISRFGEGDELIESLFDYSAVQPYNAAYFLENLTNQILWGKLNFPYIVGGGMVYAVNDYIITSVFLNSFSSIVGSFYKDFGYYTILFASIFALFFDKLMLFSKKKKSFLYFYIYCLYFSVMFVGVFYNKYTSPAMVRVVVFIGVLIVMIEMLTKKNVK